MSDTAVDIPHISVVITTYNAAATVQRCLESLQAQDSSLSFEIIVVDSSTDNTPEIVRRFPQVRFYHFDHRMYCGDGRNFAISLARADIIAFLDADCIAQPNWIHAILQAHLSPALAIGGAIQNAEPANLVSQAAYLCEFSQWMPGLPSRWIDDAAGANLSYKRKVFDIIGRLIEGTYCSDTQFHWRMAQIGESIWFEPSIVVSHQSIQNFLKFIHHEFEHGNSFARVRVGARRFTPLRRAVYAGLWFLIPVKLLLEIIWRCFAARQNRKALLLSLPILCAGLTAWAAGEGVGYLQGSSPALAIPLQKSGEPCP